MLGVTLRHPLRAIVSGAPAVVEPWVSLRTAARRLTADVIGVLLVEDARGLLGIVSERDIVRSLAEGADPDAERVRDVMTDDLAALDGDATVMDAALVMATQEIRHVVVVEAEQAVGVVSVRDLLAVVVEEAAAAPN
jgi:signal-transduction protein with cAMP-binding, CBS, and nucleotidyltransferase domain